MCCECCENWKCVSIFFGIWNIITGIGFVSFSATFLKARDWNGSMDGHIDFEYILKISVLITSVIHILSGAAILVGIFMDIKLIFLVGLILSNFLPIATILTIFMPVVHIICLLKAIKFYGWNWE